jgi:valyl-tRNA synthetase
VFQKTLLKHRGRRSLKRLNIDCLKISVNTDRDLPSQYNAKDVEDKWYRIWEESGYFVPKKNSNQQPFTIVIPPPNVTGMLHMGHALNNTIQDILTRWRRMEGFPSLWLPGVDHAGIATQNVVERKLAKENKTRHELGREKFIEEVWKWKDDHGSTIVKQLKRLGASCDWTRERFTMDEGLSCAVRETFVSLYERKLIYRGDYIINWCPRCQTALSDEEAVHQEVEGTLYHIKYSIENSNEHIIVATTRPETMLGDTAVAIHPNDERYSSFHGKKVILPILNRKIPVIQDDIVDPDFGTGIVKVTPAHDPNDFEIGNRHKLERINVMNADGSINELGGPYKGLDRFEARRQLVHDLEERGLFVKRVSHGHAVGHCYRCHTIVEPYLSKQWFVKMKPLAEKALQAQRAGKVTFSPERWSKVYVGWLENIRDWCISRQIWWGHQIPVWYCDLCGDEGTFVSREDLISCPKCGSKNLRQDPDVLDTWFSSWLWPFSTLGWPQKSDDLAYFYPTSVLVTAQEIIFFWVARMIMAGLEFMNEVPFHTVFIHGTVRVEGGQKMSKSLGNVIDPLEIINEMGADALRFSMMMVAATDVFLSRQKFEMGRNFTNKIWNAARFIFRNIAGLEAVQDIKKDAECLSDIDKWLLVELDRTIQKTTENLAACRFFEAANSVYHFFWHSLCDWYLELVKPVLNSGTNKNRIWAVQSVLVSVLDQCLRLMHPFMPFISEEVWQLLKERIPASAEMKEKSIMLSSWPKPAYASAFEVEVARVEHFQAVVIGIRDLRSRLGLKPSETITTAFVVAKAKEVTEAVLGFKEEVCFFAKVENLIVKNSIKKETGMVGRIYKDLEVFVGGLTPENLKKETDRTQKKISELERLIDSITKRLENLKFVSKAPKEVVEQEKERKKSFEEQLSAYQENLNLFS